MKKQSIFLAFLLPIIGLSQTQKDTIVTELNEIIVSPKIPKNYQQLPNQVEVITAKQIDFQNFQTTAEMLSNSGSLFVQKSQQGAGSPSIRGFEASRVLLLVDGVRMNNLIFRAGHLQNVITVDECILDNVGIFYGPSSSLFGSDALGGAVVMTTKRPKYLAEAQKSITGAVASRFSSSNYEKSGNFMLNIALAKVASLTSFAFNDFDDLKMGKKKNHNGDFFGELPFYVENINGVDQLVANENKYVQKNSGYKQYNFMQKVVFKTDSGFEHGFNFQFSTSSKVPRYDRLTDPSSSSGLKNAVWYYGPQQRLLAIYSVSKNNAFFGSDMKINGAFQKVKESRHNRKFGNYNLQNREEDVLMYSFSMDFTNQHDKGDLFYGFEAYYETLDSNAYSINLTSGLQSNLDTRYPNGLNSMFRNDFYISYNSKFSAHTFFNAGGRIGFAKLNSDIGNNSFIQLPFTAISQENITYSGTVGVVHHPSKELLFKVNLSSGYRVPNIDDLAKIFESVPGTLIVPNDQLVPEKTITADIGFVITTDSKKFKLENTYFYTRLFDAIVTAPFTFNGASTVDYDGSPSTVFANQNTGKAYITGLSTIAKLAICSTVDMNASFNYALGNSIENGSQVPLDHISPYFGKIGFSYSKKAVELEAYLLYNGKKALSDYSASGEDNLVYSPPNGMPAWETYNFKAAYSLAKVGTIYVGVENILDTQYRTFSSGINAPGRNIYSGIRFNF